MNEEYLTLRKKIIKVLQESNQPLNKEEILEILNIDIKKRGDIRVYEHLRHIAKTISKGQKQLIMIPPRCKNCGYIFRQVRKIKEPSRCPKCKSERIEPPKFKIIEL